MNTTPTYRYKITPTGESSNKYGPCEVCGKHAAEVFIQSEECEYSPRHWTFFQCRPHTFGHLECLKSIRRGNAIEFTAQDVKIIIENNPALIGQPCIYVTVNGRRAASTSLGTDQSEKRALQIAHEYILDSYPDGEIVNNYHAHEVKS